MFIRSERLFLRPSWPEDWQELYNALNDESIVRNLTRAPWPYTQQNAQNFVARPQDTMFPHFIITLPSENETKLIGEIELSRDRNTVQIGYWIAPRWQGNGYATEAICAVLQIAKTLGHNRVTAQHIADNPVSARILIKSGFYRTGQTRVVYSMGRKASFESQEYAIDLADLEVMKFCQAA